MKVSELRLNNLYLFTEIDIEVPGKKQTIKSITIRDLWNLEKGSDFIKADYEPLPLTEDILLRFNFTKINHIIDGVIYIKDRLKITEQFLTYWQGAYIGEIKSTHRLQNLYQSLTGEELTLK